jgi:hypothetical protein
VERSFEEPVIGTRKEARDAPTRSLGVWGVHARGRGGQNTYSWGIPLLMDLVREKVHLQLEFVLNIYKKNVALSRALYLYTNLKR